MNKDTVIGFNCPIGPSFKDHGCYVSLEDIEFAEIIYDHYDCKTTKLYMKSGNSIVVLGDAYHILGLKK